MRTAIGNAIQYLPKPSLYIYDNWLGYNEYYNYHNIPLSQTIIYILYIYIYIYSCSIIHDVKFRFLYSVHVPY